MIFLKTLPTLINAQMDIAVSALEPSFVSKLRSSELQLGSAGVTNNTF